jgi:transcriptional regulator with XRE-family HTH domain
VVKNYRMKATEWINKAQLAGWRVTSAKDRTINLQCSRQGCAGSLSLPIENLGPTPAPCTMPHVGQYGAAAYDQYKLLVAQLVRKRRALGMSQEDINAAAGMSDGHINKLEAFARTAQFPTLQLWAATLGTEITLRPAPLPPATARTIDRRASDPYAANMARHKADKPQRALFDDR